MTLQPSTQCLVEWRPEWAKVNSLRTLLLVGWGSAQPVVRPAPTVGFRLHPPSSTVAKQSQTGSILTFEPAQTRQGGLEDAYAAGSYGSLRAMMRSMIY